MTQTRELFFLKGKIRERGETYKSMSEKIGISLTGFSNKINSRHLFTIDEMDSICKILEITNEEIPKYFFNRTLRNAV